MKRNSPLFGSGPFNFCCDVNVHDNYSVETFNFPRGHLGTFSVRYSRDRSTDFINFPFVFAFQVFDWESFADSVRYHCLQSKHFDPTIETIVLSSASVFFSFVKDGKDDVSTPCWVQLDVLQALHQGQGDVYGGAVCSLVLKVLRTRLPYVIDYR